MALDNKDDRTMTDLKAAFFDLFREHTGDAVEMIESLANGGSEDVVNIETSIFQRIILLNRTANSIGSLEENVDMLHHLKTSGSINKKVPVKNNATQVVSATPSNGKVVATPVHDKPNLSTSSIVSTPASTPSKPAPVSSVANVSNQAVPVADSIPPVSNPTPPASVSKPVESVPPAKVELPTPVENKPLDKREETVHPVDVKAPVSSVGEKKENSEPTQLFRMSDKKAKAILVNNKQYGKLNASRQKQFSLLNFGAYSTEAAAARIDSLMKKASSLYKEGRVSEAQAMYAEISALNKRLNQEQGRDKLLIRKAA